MLENPYFQAFCGEEFFRHELPFDRSSMARWRKRIGADKLEELLAETIRVVLSVSYLVTILGWASRRVLA